MAAPTSAASAPPQQQQVPGRCGHFIPRKGRFCCWPVLPDQQFCGQHVWLATGAGEARLPCPANPNQ
jgi:hypothetical protein